MRSHRELALLGVAAELYPTEKLARAEAAIDALFEEAKNLPQHEQLAQKPNQFDAGRRILDSTLDEQAAVLLATFGSRSPRNLGLYRGNNDWPARVVETLRAQLSRRRLPFDRKAVAHLFLDLNASQHSWSDLPVALPIIERFREEHGLDAPMKAVLAQIKDDVVWPGDPVSKRIEKLLEERLKIAHGEAWADALRADLAAMEAEKQGDWNNLLTHCADSNASKPSQKWLKEAEKLLKVVGSEDFAAKLEKYLHLFASRPEPIHIRNADVLKGLVWCASLVEQPSLRRALADAVPSCLKNLEIPHQFDAGDQMYDYSTIGPRAPRLANALIWVLSNMNSIDAVAQLSRVRLRIRHGGALKSVERALTEIAKRLNVAPDDLEELAVPDFGLENGTLRRTFGEWTAEVELSGGKGVWNWQAEGKKSPKSVPASVKSDFAAELKEMKGQVAEIEKLLPAHKERLDLLLREEKSWPLAVWRERYLDHPFTVLLARRIIWEWSTADDKWHAFLPHGDAWLNQRSEAAPHPPENATIRLWHPIRHDAETVETWRRLLEDKGIQQPLKQAHREIYPLTEAERQTRTYSNRFAAHVIRQHQFNALCATRGWKNRLRLMVDDVAPPATKEMPRYNLRAEFWIEGIGDEYNRDTNETGTFLRLATDQVRFYRMEAPQNFAHVSGGGYAANWRTAPAEPLPLEEIPPLIFSEVMRDVDLFVGVASVGNDPTWNDGGPDGRFINYWQDYSFGELSATAQTRRDLLERLLPRLKIADRCSLDGKFLMVRGDLRTYKIHLGSGNILMEPNDQYLCIVPDRRAQAGGDKIFLPFEGDQSLSIILSKAFLLTGDKQITDPTIVRQIKI